MTLYGIKNCDTVKAARQWLEQNTVEYRFHDLRSDGLTQELLLHWFEETDWKTLLNQRSTSWRQLDDGQKSDLSETKALHLMQAFPTLIKRPVLDTGSQIIIGFKAEDYQSRLS